MKNYTADEVTEFIDIVVEEAETSIEQSYKEGYKQGVLQFEPEIEYYKTLTEQMKTNQKKQNTRLTIKSVSIGFVIGSASSVATYYFIKSLLKN